LSLSWDDACTTFGWKAIQTPRDRQRKKIKI
jgi:hypothetical protein